MTMNRTRVQIDVEGKILEEKQTDSLLLLKSIITPYNGHYRYANKCGK